MRGTVPARRRRLIAVIITLLLVDAVLLGFHEVRRRQSTTTRERVAGAFAALQQKGLAAALDSLEQAAATDSAVLRDGHQLAHALGRDALAQARGDAAVIAQCRPDFGSGCYHGVVESFLRRSGTIDMSGLERMCSAAGSEDQPAPVYECAHGLGHGILGAVSFDVRAALRHCDQIANSRYAASCREGVFMEAINAAAARARALDGHSGHEHGSHAGSGAAGLSLERDNPYAPCDGFSDPYAASCWLFQAFVILERRGFDAASALETCDSAPEARAGNCYKGLGLQLAGLFQRNDAWIIDQCAKGRPDLAPECAAGAIIALTAMDWSGARGARFCAASLASWKQACYQALGTMLDVFASQARRAEVCGGVTGEHADVCRSGSAGRQA